MYTGTKQAGGSPFDRAGLTNGSLVGRLRRGRGDRAGVPRCATGRASRCASRSRAVNWNTPDGDAQNVEARDEGPEPRPDRGRRTGIRRTRATSTSSPREGGRGATTDGSLGRDGGGLWRLRFDDIEQPELGGTLTLLLDGSEEPKLNKPDNMTIDGERQPADPGGSGQQRERGRIVAYRIADGARGVLARFDPALFGEGGLPNGNPCSADQRSTRSPRGSSTRTPTIGPRWFLFDAQVHRAARDPELVPAASCSPCTSTAGGTYTTSEGER